MTGQLDERGPGPDGPARDRRHDQRTRGWLCSTRRCRHGDPHLLARRPGHRGPWPHSPPTPCPPRCARSRPRGGAAAGRPNRRRPVRRPRRLGAPAARRCRRPSSTASCSTWSAAHAATVLGHADPGTVHRGRAVQGPRLRLADRGRAAQPARRGHRAAAARDARLRPPRRHGARRAPARQLAPGDAGGPHRTPSTRSSTSWSGWRTACPPWPSRSWTPARSRPGWRHCFRGGRRCCPAARRRRRRRSGCRPPPPTSRSLESHRRRACSRVMTDVNAPLITEGRVTGLMPRCEKRSSVDYLKRVARRTCTQTRQRLRDHGGPRPRSRWPW